MIAGRREYVLLLKRMWYWTLELQLTVCGMRAYCIFFNCQYFFICVPFEVLKCLKGCLLLSYCFVMFIHSCWYTHWSDGYWCRSQHCHTWLDSASQLSLYWVQSYVEFYPGNVTYFNWSRILTTIVIWKPASLVNSIENKPRGFFGIFMVIVFLWSRLAVLRSQN